MHNIFCYTNDANNINERNTMTHAGGTMDTEELRHILDQHTLWIRSEGGKRANLTRANLTGANLYRANLTGADLTGANLTGADLTEANLTEARGAFATAYLGKHHAVAAGGYISIGCQRHTYAEWLEQYAAIGARNNYTPAEIERYGTWIKLVVAWLSEETPAPEAA